MRAFLVTLTLYLVIKVFLLGVGSAVGFLLHWMVPAVDLGSSILIGVVATGLSVHFFGKLTAALGAYDEEGGPVTFYAVSPPQTKRRRRKS